MMRNRCLVVLVVLFTLLLAGTGAAQTVALLKDINSTGNSVLHPGRARPVPG